MSSPAHKLRIGSLQATIWRNLAEKGNWYSVKLSRGYKTDEGWRETDNLGYEDCLPAAKLLDLAHTWTCTSSPPTRRAAARRTTSLLSETGCGSFRTVIRNGRQLSAVVHL